MKRKEILLSTRLRAARLLPRPLGWAAYAGALRLAQLLMWAPPKTGARVWARNSFVSGAHIPLLSDLDLTCWFETVPAPREARRAQRRLRYLKTVFRFLGETNFYARPTAPEWLRLINPVELARDPLLADVAGFAPTTPTLAQTACALLRFLESDWQNLRANPRARLPKWSGHLTRAGLPVPSVFDARSVTRLCLRGLRLGESAEQTAATAIAHVLESGYRGVPLHDLTVGEDEAAFFPHRLCFRDDLPRVRDPIKQEVQTSQIAWELWGLACRAPAIKPDAGVIAHLRGLRRLAQRLDPSPALAQIEESFDQFETDLRAVPGSSFPVPGTA